MGVPPTVVGRDVTVEARIRGFYDDSYGGDVRLEFVRRIRPEMNVGGLEELKAQIAADVAQVREELAL